MKEEVQGRVGYTRGGVIGVQAKGLLIDWNRGCERKRGERGVRGEDEGERWTCKAFCSGLLLMNGKTVKRGFGGWAIHTDLKYHR